MSRNQPQEVHDLVEALRTCGARLSELIGSGALDGIPEAALPEVVLGLRAAIEPLEAAATCVVGRLHASAATLPDGHVSVSRWLQAQAKTSSGTSKQLIARGRALGADYAATGNAWLMGDVSGDHVRVITIGVDRAVRSLPAAVKDDCRAEAEGFLLRLAGHLTPDELHKAAQHLRFTLDPDGTDQDELDNSDAQQISFTRVGDGVAVKGFLTHQAAALVQTALDQVVDGWYRRGELPAEQRDADDADPDDPRVQRARRLRRPHLDALALAGICGDATESGSLGGRHGALPRVALTADLATLTSRGGELHAPHHETPAALSPSAMLLLLCDASVVTAITGSGNGSGCGRTGAEGLLRTAGRAVLYVGREQRTVSRAQRAALAVVYPHCAFPGCRVPASRCHGHHVRHWAEGGSTDPDNLVLVCHAHHGQVHHGGWSIVATGPDPLAPGHWTFVPPPRRGRP